MKVVVQNKKARHDFAILETIEAGIALRGTEVKSLREGRANLRDSYALLENGEVLLRGLQIMPYSHTSDRALDPMRDRKLLLNRDEITKLTVKINEKGMTLVALKVYFTPRGIAKVELGLAKGKSSTTSARRSRNVRAAATLIGLSNAPVTSKHAALPSMCRVGPATASLGFPPQRAQFVSSALRRVILARSFAMGLPRHIGRAPHPDSYSTGFNPLCYRRGDP